MLCELIETYLDKDACGVFTSTYKSDEVLDHLFIVGFVIEIQEDLDKGWNRLSQLLLFLLFLQVFMTHLF